jgi:hypothetical protein
MKKEYIVCSAIWFKNGGKYSHQPKNIENGLVITGLRHSNCFFIASKILDKKVESVQGFLTSHNKFVSRTEAYEIALNAMQIEEISLKVLLSEDLY